MKQQTFQTTAVSQTSADLAFRRGFPEPNEDKFLERGTEWAFVCVPRARLNGDTRLLRIGPSVLDQRSGEVETPTGKHRLRQKELELLMHLFRHATTTFTREELLQAVWNYQCRLLTRTVDQTIATLRKKIEAAPERPRLIQTVYGIGYRLML